MARTLIIFIWIWMAMVANAFWEAYAEGKRAWGSGKLGWKIKTKNHVWLTAYHFWLFWVMWPMLLMLPLIIFGWDSHLFGVILSAYSSGLIVEDFVWFLVNPAFNFSNFNSKYVNWYPWVKLGNLEIPAYYLFALALSLLSWYLLWE